MKVVSREQAVDVAIDEYNRGYKEGLEAGKASVSWGGDLISRQAAIDAFTTVDMGGTFCYCDSIVRTLENLPSVQPEITLESAIDYLNSIDWLPEHDRIITESAKRKSAERKGKWIEDARTYYETLNERGYFVDQHTEYFVDDIACSECLKRFSTIDNETERFDFCPNCGADLRGEDNDNL